MTYQALQAYKQEIENKMTEQTVFANSTLYQPKIKLMTFSGFEGEDFRTFEQTLENYFALNNITNDERKLIIMKTQLYHAARTYVNKLLKKEPASTYNHVMGKLKTEYITPELIQTYEYAFNNMEQGRNEHPRAFYARLFEAAELAEIESESMIQSRFRAGVHPIVQQHCISLGCKDIDSWLKAAEGYWTAHHPHQVTMADNPFHPRRVHNNNDAVEMHGYDTFSSPALNAIATTNSMDMKDIQHILRNIVKEELGNRNNNQGGYQKQNFYPYNTGPRREERYDINGYDYNEFTPSAMRQMEYWNKNNEARRNNDHRPYQQNGRRAQYQNNQRPNYPNRNNYQTYNHNNQRPYSNQGINNNNQSTQPQPSQTNQQSKN